MANEVEQATKTATDVADRLFTYGEQLAEKLNELGQQYGPQVVDLAMNVYRIQAAQELVKGGLFAAIGVAAAVICYRLTVRLVSWVKDDDDAAILFLPLALAGYLPTLAFLGSGIARLTNVWNWIGLWHPEVLMAKQVLGL